MKSSGISFPSFSFSFCAMISTPVAGDGRWIRVQCMPAAFTTSESTAATSRSRKNTPANITTDCMHEQPAENNLLQISDEENAPTNHTERRERRKRRWTASIAWHTNSDSCYGILGTVCYDKLLDALLCSASQPDLSHSSFHLSFCLVFSFLSQLL
jgi:hypothetical protein